MRTSPLGPSIGLPRGHGALERCAEINGGDAYDRSQGGAFGRAPFGATKRRTVWRATHVKTATEAFGELLVGP
eukprot:2785598-Pyramimonas_sp.AAC.1